jgi:hypothetical protein
MLSNVPALYQSSTGVADPRATKLRLANSPADLLARYVREADANLLNLFIKQCKLARKRLTQIFEMTRGG